MQSLDFVPAHIHSFFLSVRPIQKILTSVKGEMFSRHNSVFHFNLAIVAKRNLFVTLKMIDHHKGLSARNGGCALL